MAAEMCVHENPDARRLRVCDCESHSCNQSCIRQLLPKQCMKLNRLHFGRILRAKFSHGTSIDKTVRLELYTSNGKSIPKELNLPTKMLHHSLSCKENFWVCESIIQNYHCCWLLVRMIYRYMAYICTDIDESDIQLSLSVCVFRLKKFVFLNTLLQYRFHKQPDNGQASSTNPKVNISCNVLTCLLHYLYVYTQLAKYAWCNEKQNVNLNKPVKL